MKRARLPTDAVDFNVQTSAQADACRSAEDTDFVPSDLASFLHASGSAPASMLDGDPYRDVPASTLVTGLTDFQHPSDPYREGPGDSLRSVCVRENQEADAPLLPCIPEYKDALQQTQLELKNPELALRHWNLLLGFLHSGQPDFRITKTDVHKYRVKAATLRGHSCEFKVSLYENRAQMSVVMEFQRRCGDVLAFARVFRQAAVHFSNYIVSTPKWTELQELPAPPCHDDSPRDLSEDLGPLLGMVCTERPELMEEAVVGLAAVFEARSSTSFCTPELLQSLRLILGLKASHARPASYRFCGCLQDPAMRADRGCQGSVAAAAAAGHLLAALATNEKEAQRLVSDKLLEELRLAAHTDVQNMTPARAAAVEAARAATRRLLRAPMTAADPAGHEYSRRALQQLAALAPVEAAADSAVCWNGRALHDGRTTQGKTAAFERRCASSPEYNSKNAVGTETT